NNYETRDGHTIPGTRVATDEGRVYYPNGNDSRAILQDVIGRTNELLANRNRPRAEVLADFADIAHGYHQAMPFDRGSDGISQAYLRGLYQAATGERMPAIRYIDVNAQLMPRDSFRTWLLGQLN